MKKSYSRFLRELLLLTLPIVGCAVPRAVPGEEGAVYKTSPSGSAFYEEFDGEEINQDLFEIEDGYKYWDSWFSAEKTSVSGGVALLAMDSGDTYRELLKVGGIRSLAYYSYGRFTFRAKANMAPGMVTALFLYNEDRDMEEGGTHEEIDIELSSKFPEKASLVTYHWDEWTSADEGLQNDMHRGGIKDLREIPGLEDFDSTQFNTYVIDWRPGKVTWYVNEIKVEEFEQAIPTTPMQICLDSYNTREWDSFSDPDPEGSGALEVDSVGYTSGEEAQ